MKERMLLIRKRYQRWSRLIGLRSISHCRHRLFVVRIALIGKNYCNERRDNTKLLKIMIILSIYIDYVHMYTPDMSPCSLSILSVYYFHYSYFLAFILILCFFLYVDNNNKK